MSDMTLFACSRGRPDKSTCFLRFTIPAAAAYFALGSSALAQALPAADRPVAEPLSLKAVIALALQNNGEIKGSDLGKIIEEERIKSARQAFDLRLDGGYFYQSLDTPQNAQEFAATGGGGLFQPPLTTPRIFEQRNHTARLGLSKKLETGTIVELGTTTRVLDNTLNRGTTSLYNPEWETFTGLTVTQPLLRDWGQQANTAEIRVAKANARIADLEWQSRTAQVVAEVMRRYYDVIFTLENLAVQRESIALAERYELRQAAELIDMKSAELDYATNQSRPRLDLVASGGYRGLDGDFGSSYGNAADRQGPEWSAGVQFNGRAGLCPEMAGRT